jgi:hypothetical protein
MGIDYLSCIGNQQNGTEFGGGAVTQLIRVRWLLLIDVAGLLFKNIILIQYSNLADDSGMAVIKSSNLSACLKV